MAAKHVRAVQRLRRQFINQLDYEVLAVIACDVGNDGSPAITSYRGMAERAGCHYNTVDKHVQTLAEAGWITIEKRGKYHHYHLSPLADCDDNEIVTANCDNPEQLSQPIVTIMETLSQSIVTITETLSQIDARLSQVEQQLSQPLSQPGHEIVTTASTANVTEVREDLGKEEREEGEEGEDFPPPPLSQRDGLSDAAVMPAFPDAEWFTAKGLTPPANDQEWAMVKHPAIRTWVTVVGKFPGYPALPVIVENLGIRPSAPVLRKVWQTWQINGYNPNNIAGMLDRYAQDVNERPVSGDLFGQVAIPAELEGIIRR